MSELYVIADTHFSEDTIRRFENRPFANTEEMDEELIRRWNETVGEDDVVWHLGDFGAKGHEKEYVSRLNGKIYLIKGNHDTGSDDYYRECGFARVYDLPIVYEGFWLFSHEPLYTCENMPYGNLFGHVHASPLYKDFSSHHYCVSVERCDYRPLKLSVALDTIRAEKKTL